jgi:CheY-like chemotaxis protein
MGSGPDDDLLVRLHVFARRLMQDADMVGKRKPFPRLDRILIVDDEEAIVFLFRAILDSALKNTKIETVGDGAMAVASFRAKRHDVLLMDLHMPVMDGYSAFRKIEELCTGENWNMPSVVFCTGFAPPEILSRIIASDPRHGFLPKPVSPDDLINAVKSRLPV